MSNQCKVIPFPLERARPTLDYSDESADLRSAIRKLLAYRDNPEVGLAIECVEERVQQLMGGVVESRE